MTGKGNFVIRFVGTSNTTIELTHIRNPTFIKDLETGLRSWDVKLMLDATYEVSEGNLRIEGMRQNSEHLGSYLDDWTYCTPEKLEEAKKLYFVNPDDWEWTKPTWFSKSKLRMKAKYYLERKKTLKEYTASHFIILG